MNRAWITGLTVASVAGTGGVAFATMTASTHPASAAPSPVAALSETTASVAPRAYSFQAGAAGQVNLTAADGVLTVDSTVPSTGWLVLSYTGPGTHVEVQLGDGMQIVTFAADLVNGEVEAGITATPAPTLPTVPATDPATTPAPAPAVPVVVLQPTSQPPATSHTSSPSSGGDDDHESDDHDDDHESEDGDD